MVKHLITGKTYVVGTHWNCRIGQFQCVPTTYVNENKETLFKFTLRPSIMSIVFGPF